MKLFYLFLAGLLISPCPVCWVGDVVTHYTSETGMPTECCASGCSCSAGIHLPDNHPENKQPENHQCPCQCHAKGMTFAQLVHPVNVRGFAMDFSVLVNENCCFFEKITMTDNEIAQVSLFLSVPLRI